MQTVLYENLMRKTEVKAELKFKDMDVTSFYIHIKNGKAVISTMANDQKVVCLNAHGDNKVRAFELNIAYEKIESQSKMKNGLSFNRF